jgi:hypothetical protein
VTPRHLHHLYLPLKGLHALADGEAVGFNFPWIEIFVGPYDLDHN